MNRMHWFLIIHEGNSKISTIQLDVKSRNILFVVVEDLFVRNPSFFFRLLKNGIG